MINPAEGKIGEVFWTYTWRYGSIKRGDLFKVGKKGSLVSPRNLSEAQFVAAEDRSASDVTKQVKVERYR